MQGKKTYSYLRNIGLDFELVEDQFCLTSFYNENGSTQNGITYCFYSPFIIKSEITPLSSSYIISGLVPVCWLPFQCF